MYTSPQIIVSNIKLFLCSTNHRTMKTYPVLNYAPRYENAWGNIVTAPLILNLGNRWR